MLKTQGQREARQLEMREGVAARARFEEEHSNLLTLAEAARELRVSVSTARRLFQFEPGVMRLQTPGSNRVMLRIPRSVVERVRRRMSNL